MLKQIFASISTEANISKRYSYGMLEGTKKETYQNLTQEGQRTEIGKIKTLQLSPDGDILNHASKHKLVSSNGFDLYP